MAIVRFYTTSGCHLCEQAWALADPIIKRYEYTLQPIDIMDDPHSEARFGEAIPVLEREDTRQCLYWPFDSASLYRFLL